MPEPAPSLTAVDTTPEADRELIAALRRMDGPGRVQQCFVLTEELRRVVEAGVRHWHPTLGDEAVRLETIRLWIGDDLFRIVYDANGERPV